MRLIFIRHAEPDYEHDSLTKKGRYEAELLARRTARWENIEAIFCSPLGRAQETASYTLKALGRDAVTCDWLREFAYEVKDPVTGEIKVPWDFLPGYFTKIPEMYDKDKWLDTEIYRSNPKIKPDYNEICRRMDDLLLTNGYMRDGNMYRADASMTDGDDEKNIVFFCHFGVTCMILSHLLGISPVILLENTIAMPTGVTVLNSEKSQSGALFRIQFYGDTSHLISQGEPVSGSGAFSAVFQG